MRLRAGNTVSSNVIPTEENRRRGNGYGRCVGGGGGSSDKGNSVHRNHGASKVGRSREESDDNEKRIVRSE